MRRPSLCLLFTLCSQGSPPAELNGAFYRVQPDPQFPPLLGDDIAFNGDGMITRFHFHNGQCDFRQRWAHTDKWKLEHEAGRPLFGAYRNPLTDDPSVAGRIRGTANTNAFVHGGKLYALKEDSPALVMDPVTLETEGYTDFGGMTGQTFTAHPKIDPETGDMIAFGYASKGVLTRDMTYYEVSPDGALKREIWFENPLLLHDARLRDHRRLRALPRRALDRQLGAADGRACRISASIPRCRSIWACCRGASDTPRDIRWFKRGNCFASHVMNAFQEGTKIHFDTPEAEEQHVPLLPDIHDAPFNGPESASFLTRWTVDMASNSDAFESCTRLTDMMGEFPRIDDRFAGETYRHGWLLEMDMRRPVELRGGSAGGLLMNSLGLVDHETGEEQHWWCGPVSSLQEACFIPRSKTAPEGDGWIVQICNRLEEHRSDLLLFDAADCQGTDRHNQHSDPHALRPARQLGRRGRHWTRGKQTNGLGREDGLPGAPRALNHA